VTTRAIILSKLRELKDLTWLLKYNKNIYQRFDIATQLASVATELQRLYTENEIKTDKNLIQRVEKLETWKNSVERMWMDRK
jgi:hypothetical protein